MTTSIITFVRKATNRIKIDTRKRLNPYLAPSRQLKLDKQGISKDFTIISNNCWAGLVYQHFGLPYNTPTAGLFFFAQDYIKFVYNIKEYLTKELKFISLEESRYCETLNSYGGECVTCPIAICGDIEIIFMHYHSPEEAEEKWRRRSARINWDNIIYKFSEMNGCTEDDLRAFDALPVEKKVVFTHKDYGLKNQAVYTEFKKTGYIPNDTDNFRKYINLYDLISGRFNKIRK